VSSIWQKICHSQGRDDQKAVEDGEALLDEDQVGNLPRNDQVHHLLVEQLSAPAVISGAYLIFVFFFTRAKFLEKKIYTEKTRKLRQNTQ